MSWWTRRFGGRTRGRSIMNLRLQEVTGTTTPSAKLPVHVNWVFVVTKVTTSRTLWTTLVRTEGAFALRALVLVLVSGHTSATASALYI